MTLYSYEDLIGSTLGMKEGAIPNNLLERRARAGLTQVELAKRAGVSNEAVSQLECGARRGRRVTQVQISEALGLHVREVFPHR